MSIGTQILLTVVTVYSKLYLYKYIGTLICSVGSLDSKLSIRVCTYKQLNDKAQITSKTLEKWSFQKPKEFPDLVLP